MKHTLFSVLLLAFPALGYASVQCPSATHRATLNDLSFYSETDAVLQQSDIQGLVGVGGSLTTNHFFFKGSGSACLVLGVQQDLTYANQVRFAGAVEVGGRSSFQNSRVLHAKLSSGGLATLSDSSVDGAIISPFHPKMTNSSRGPFIRAGFAPTFDYAALNSEMHNRSVQLSQLAVTATPQVNGAQLQIHLQGPRTVVALNELQLSYPAPAVVIDGTADQELVINVSGVDLDLSHTDVTLLGGVSFNKITWNFFEAQSLVIEYTQNPAYGIPGVILAPNAITQMYDGLITGSVYVHSLFFDEHNPFRNTAQINAAPPVGHRPYD